MERAVINRGKPEVNNLSLARSEETIYLTQKAQAKRARAGPEF